MISIGPLAFSLKTLIWLIAIWLGLWIGSRLAQRKALQMEWSLYGLLLLGLVAARLSFVLRYSESYSGSIFSIIDIRDGGWDPWTGIAAVSILTLVTALRNSPKFGPMFAAILASVVIGMGGTLGMDLTRTDAPGLLSLEVRDLDGNERNLDEFRGRPLVINLWASWCAPCVREMPVLERAQQEFPEVGFVFLNQAESATVIKQFLQKHPISIDNLLLDENAQAGAQYGSRLLPTTLFFDLNGKLVDMRLGELSSATLQNRLAAIATR